MQTALLRTARRWSTARAGAGGVHPPGLSVNARQGPARPAPTARRGAAGDVDVAVPVTDGVADRDQLLRAARQLPAGQRAVLVLRYFDDLSVAETAAALGYSGGDRQVTDRPCALDRLRSALVPTPTEAGERRC